MQLDDLDRKATQAFEGYVVRKDLVRTFSRQFGRDALLKALAAQAGRELAMSPEYESHTSKG